VADTSNMGRVFLFVCDVRHTFAACPTKGSPVACRHVLIACREWGLKNQKPAQEDPRPAFWEKTGRSVCG